MGLVLVGMLGCDEAAGTDAGATADAGMAADAGPSVDAGAVDAGGGGVDAGGGGGDGSDLSGIVVAYEGMSVTGFDCDGALGGTTPPNLHPDGTVILIASQCWVVGGSTPNFGLSIAGRGNQGVTGTWTGSTEIQEHLTVSYSGEAMSGVGWNMVTGRISDTSTATITSWDLSTRTITGSLDLTVTDRMMREFTITGSWTVVYPEPI